MKFNEKDTGWCRCGILSWHYLTPSHEYVRFSGGNWKTVNMHKTLCGLRFHATLDGVERYDHAGKLVSTYQDGRYQKSPATPWSNVSWQKTKPSRLMIPDANLCGNCDYIQSIGGGQATMEKKEKNIVLDDEPAASALPEILTKELMRETHIVIGAIQQLQKEITNINTRKEVLEKQIHNSQAALEILLAYIPESQRASDTLGILYGALISARDELWDGFRFVPRHIQTKKSIECDDEAVKATLACDPHLHEEKTKHSSQFREHLLASLDDVRVRAGKKLLW